MRRLWTRPLVSISDEEENITLSSSLNGIGGKAENIVMQNWQLVVCDSVKYAHKHKLVVVLGCTQPCLA